MVVTSAITPGPTTPGGEKGEVRVRLLATTDLHAHLYPYNYYANRRDDGLGLASVAALIEQARAECPNVLLFDNGDTLQGAPLGDAAVSGLMPKDAVHPMIAAMNALRYDAVTLGNHDFDFGLDRLDAALSRADFPVVVANVRRAGGPETLCLPHVMLERHLVDNDGALRPVRVGVTGVTPPQVMQWGRALLAGRIEVDPMLPAAERAVAALRAAGADLVVLLAHTGLGRPDTAPDGENLALRLSRIAGLDAVVAGHTHRLHPEGVADRDGTGDAPIVQPGFFGSHLGQIDLDLRRSGRGASASWRVVGSAARLRTASEVGEGGRRAIYRRLRQTPGFRAEILRGHRLTREFAAQPLGHAGVALETYFSLCAPCAATQLIADAQRWAVSDLVAARADLSGLPLLSAASPFKAGGRNGPEFYTDVPAGPLQLRHVADLYSYSNGLTLLRATGARVRAWLERSASAFRRVVPGEETPQPLLDLDFASYNFDRIDGLHYEIDVAQPALTNAEGDETHAGPGRIRNLRHADGRPLDDAEEVLLVTNTYRAAGGGHFPAASECEIVHSTPDPVRDTLAAFVASRNASIVPRVTRNWRFAPLGGTPVIYETGPGALGHAERAAALGLAFDGIGPEGFARYLMEI